MKYKKIRSIDELKKLSRDKTIYCFISLAGGICRSSKKVRYNSTRKVFSIFNSIDSTQEFLADRELYTESNIGKAIDKEAFYLVNPM